MHDSLMKIDLLSARNYTNPIVLQGYPAGIPITVLIMLSWFLSGSFRFVSPTVDPTVIKVNQVHIILSYPVRSTLTLRRLMSYIYGTPILDVSRSHTTTQHSR